TRAVSRALIAQVLRTPLPVRRDPIHEMWGSGTGRVQNGRHRGIRAHGIFREVQTGRAFARQSVQGRRGRVRLVSEQAFAVRVDLREEIPVPEIRGYEFAVAHVSSSSSASFVSRRRRSTRASWKASQSGSPGRTEKPSPIHVVNEILKPLASIDGIERSSCSCSSYAYLAAWALSANQSTSYVSMLISLLHDAQGSIHLSMGSSRI